MKRAKIGRVPTFSFARDGHDYTVVGMRGHILNLDYPDEFNDWANTDLKRLRWARAGKEGPEPAFGIALKALAHGSAAVTFATDFDPAGGPIRRAGLTALRGVCPNVAGRRAA